MQKWLMPCLALLLLLNLSAFARPMASLQGFTPPSDYPNASDYLAVLQEFPRYAERLWHPGHRGDPTVGYFNTGAHDHNQMRSLSNFIFVYALLATRSGWDEAATGIRQETLLKHARMALRYLTATHVTGDKVCTDGVKWGKQPEQWVAPWVISKAIAGARLIWGWLTEEERRAVERVVTYQANYLLNVRALSGDRRYLGGEFPALTAHAELNSLNGELLAWASSLYPNHPHAQRWREKAQEFFMNAFSVEADRYDTTLVDGKPVNQWVYTTNLHPDFTLEAHGAYQFDYIGCPLHSRAWAYYAFLSHEQPVPQALLHHVPDVWGAVKRTHLYGGRFAYLQGKDWGRYVYGLYFIVPALVMIQNEFGDPDARLIEQLRFRAFAWEQQQNFDGGIFSRRFAYRTRGWPPIYESDAYANLGLAYLLHQYALPTPASDMVDFQRRVEGTVHSRYAEFLYTRSPELFVSFSWRHLSRRYPLALFVPGDDALAEWAEGNLIGHLAVQGADMKRASLRHQDQVLEDGFVTTGLIREAPRSFRYTVDHALSFTALPKDGVALLLEQLVATDRILVTENWGLAYRLPNDLFNESVRQVAWDKGVVELRSLRGQTDMPIFSRWINIDDRLGIIALNDAGYFRIQAGQRNLWYGEVHDQVDYVTGPQSTFYAPGEVIREQAYLLVSGDRHQTRRLAVEAAQWLEAEDARVKAILLKTDRMTRLIVANFNPDPVETEVRFPGGRSVRVRLSGLETQVQREPAGSEIVHPTDNSVMVLVPAGTFLMGTSEEHFQEITRGDPYRQRIFAHELPQHTVYLDSFYIDKYEVTNAQFERFVQATGYVTDAEREGWGYVWEGYNAWPRVRGANWRSPLGPGSSIRDKMNHPVVQVSYNDALAYARWAGKRLPTEAEWEKAARGTDGRRYPWGDQYDPSRLNSADRGPGTTTPVGSYPRGASPYGAHDMLGNVWEWVADWFSPRYYRSQQVWVNPLGPPTGTHRVLRGGSWLNRLAGMRVSFRDNHVSVPDFRVQLGGFRCAKSAVPFQMDGQLRHPEDVNADGVIDVLDLVIVGSHYGQVLGANPAADVNRDGVVDLTDLKRVAVRLGERVPPPAAPTRWRLELGRLAPERRAVLQRALANLLEGWPSSPRAVRVLVHRLQAWLSHAPVIPKRSRLLPNYPNPFNAETWFPYELAHDADVTLRIFDIRGRLVRSIDLGPKRAGFYRSRNRAAYWDGRDHLGQPVSSGVYLYQLTAGDFTATRKLVVVK